MSGGSSMWGLRPCCLLPIRVSTLYEGCAFSNYLFVLKYCSVRNSHITCNFTIHFKIHTECYFYNEFFLTFCLFLTFAIFAKAVPCFAKAVSCCTTEYTPIYPHPLCVAPKQTFMVHALSFSQVYPR